MLWGASLQSRLLYLNIGGSRMALTVQFNAQAQFATRKLMGHSRSLNVSFERLSSGLRINGAKDDAAGLSITTRMEAQVRSLNRRVQNANDALSFAQTAESVLGESTNHLQRIRELALQAANTTYAENDRLALQAEIDQLKDEITNNGGLEFNHKALFNQTHSFFISEESGQSLGVRLGAAASKDLGKLIRMTSTNTVDATRALEDGGLTIIADGQSTQIRASNENDDTVSTANNANSAIAKAAAINAASELTGVTALVEKTQTGSDNVEAIDLTEQVYLKINDEVISGISIMENDTDGALKDAINAVAADSGVIATQTAEGRLLLTAQDGRNIELEVFGANTIAGFTDAVIGGKITLQSRELFEVSMQGKTNVSLGNVAEDVFDNGASSVSVQSDGKLDVGSGAYTTSAKSDFFDLGGVLDLSGNVNVADVGEYVVFATANSLAVGTLDGSNVLQQAPPFISNVAFTGLDGAYPLTLAGGTTLNLLLSNASNFDQSFGIGFGSTDPLVDAFVISLNQDGAIAFGGGGAIMADKPVSVDTIDVTTQESAVDALYVIDFAIEQLSASRAELGAVQNRLSSTITNLQVASETTAVAASRIRDADFATETAELSRVQIIQQASVSILAQANQAPSLALSLLS